MTLKDAMERVMAAEEGRAFAYRTDPTWEEKRRYRMALGRWGALPVFWAKENGLWCRDAFLAAKE